MHVFVTGASGFVGSAVVEELVAAGHRVTGLVRSDAAAARLADLGVEARRGDLTDTDGLRRAAAEADGVVHTAFIHDFARYAESCAIERRVIAALGAGLDGTGRPLIVTSATGVLSVGRALTEDDRVTAATAAGPRVASEEAAEAVAAGGGRVTAVRLPPSVHGAGDHGFVPHLVALARRTGVAAYVGEGANRWPAVHRRDAARLYRLALEAGAPDPRVHAVAEEEGVPMRTIAEAIGRGLGVPAVSLTPAAAADHFGWFAHFAALDGPASSRLTRERLGWRPTGPGLLDDLLGTDYFAPPAKTGPAA